MFSGQGSQYHQMGAEAWHGDPAYREAILACERAAGTVKGRSLSQSVLARPMADSASYDDLEETNLVLVAQGYATAQALIARGARPQALLGYSLGELIATAVAGVLTLEETMGLARAQARHVMASAREAAMVAVLASPGILLENAELAGEGEIGCINAHNHFVVSLPVDRLPTLGRWLDGREIQWVRLPVRYGFHSSLVDAAATGYADLARGVTFRPGTLPIYSAHLAARVQRFDGDHFWRVARGLVRFRDLATNLWAERPRRFVDCGPSGTLAAFLRLHLGAAAPAVPAMNQFGRNLDTFAKATAFATREPPP
jgi:bacillaene synthase trans-acting acyltransferase/trans-AT polyketide synthase/acyltransferase/oxidoreductase domain-containing protein